MNAEAPPLLSSVFDPGGQPELVLLSKSGGADLQPCLCVFVLLQDPLRPPGAGQTRQPEVLLLEEEFMAGLSKPFDQPQRFFCSVDSSKLKVKPSRPPPSLGWASGRSIPTELIDTTD